MARYTLTQQVADLTEKLNKVNNSIEAQNRVVLRHERKNKSQLDKLERLAQANVDLKSNRDYWRVESTCRMQERDKAIAANQIQDRNMHDVCNRRDTLIRNIQEAKSAIELGLYLFFPQIYAEDGSTSTNKPKARWILRVFDILNKG